MKMNVINDNHPISQAWINEADNMENEMYMDEISQHAWQYMDKNDHHSYWFTCLCETYVFGMHTSLDTPTSFPSK